jgi:hypothetical protein
MRSGVQCPAARPLPDVITKAHAIGMSARFTTRCSNQSLCKWHACPLYVARGCFKNNLNQNLTTSFPGKKIKIVTEYIPFKFNSSKFDKISKHTLGAMFFFRFCDQTTLTSVNRRI